MRRPLAVLTGGTGFVGRHIARRIAARGWRLRLLVHRSPLPVELAAFQPEVVSAGLDDRQALAHLVDGADVVIHAAGRIKAKRDSELVDANVGGSERIASAANRHASQARLILISSLAAREPTLSAYAASKCAGEDAALDAAGRIRPVVLRPGAVYGPWDRETLLFFRLASLPVFPLPASPSRVSVIHAFDLAEAVCALAEHRDVHGVFEISDGCDPGYTWREVGEALTAAVGSSPRVMALPATVIKALQLALQMVRLCGSTRLPAPEKLREILHDWPSHADAQLPQTLWQPRIGLTAGAFATAAWYRENGWLPSPRAIVRSPESYRGNGRC